MGALSLDVGKDRMGGLVRTQDACTYIRIYIHAYICVCMCVCVYVCVCVCTLSLSLTHTHTHTHTHTYELFVYFSSIDMYNNDVGKKQVLNL